MTNYSPWYIVVNIVCTIIGLTTIVCNSLAVILILRKKRHWDNSLHFILHLCIADNLSGLLVTWNVIYNVNGHRIFYECLFRSAAISSVIFTSCYILLGLSIDRYVKIVAPFHSAKMENGKAVNVYISCIWVLFFVHLGVPALTWIDEVIQYCDCAFFVVMKREFLLMLCSTLAVALLFQCVIYGHIAFIALSKGELHSAIQRRRGAPPEVRYKGPSLSSHHKQILKTTRAVLIVCGLNFVTSLPVGNSQEGDDMIRKGEIDIIFASPETLVGDPFWRSQLQELSVGVIVIDEFHTITTWGGDDETEEQDAFRKWFRYVGELRAIFPHASVLALSATCTNKIKKQVSKILNLKQGLSKFISVSPNKTNIKLVVKKIDNAIETAMYWLIDSLENMKMNFPKTLIYANSIADVSKLYSYVVSELEECAKHVEMFHSETPEEKKKTIMTSLNQADSDIRVVFATSALGMGIDVSNCHSIILFGPPRSVLDLIQEIGRVGRDGERSVAILMHNSYHLRNVTSEMKKVFSDTNDCRRKSLLKHFLSDNEMQDLDMEVDKHTCCDKCTQNCSCGDCIKLEIENLVDTGVDCFSSSSSDSDTIDYEYEADDYQSFGNENLFDDDDDFTDLNLDSVHEIL